MALADTRKAIGAVTGLLRDRLLVHPGVTVSTITVGKPEPPPNMSNSRLNLFLYEIQLDPCLRNESLDEGQPAPLWLVLKYLLTAFDTSGESDTIEAHEFLGEGMQALQELSFLPLSGSTTTVSALKDNPEVLKITFDDAPTDLLSKLMQGSDEKYRCSIGFQIRPVMIATSEAPSYSLLVGVNYLANKVIDNKGIQIDVLPGIPTLDAIAPAKFEAGDTIILKGNDLNLENLSVRMGTVELAITAQSPDTLRCLVNSIISGGEAISAGSYPISVVQNLPNGRKRESNLLVGNLLPVLTSATPNNFVRVNPADPNSKIYGNIDLMGELLGTEVDDVFVALYKDGSVIKVFDELAPIVPPPPPPVIPQTRRRVPIKQLNSIPPGQYRIILRVNGQQAKNSPEVNLMAP